MKSRIPTAHSRMLSPLGASLFVLAAVGTLLALPTALAMAASSSGPPGKDMREFATPSVHRAPGHTTVAKPLGVSTVDAAPKPEPEWRRGIIDSGLAPFPAQMFSFENQWQDVVGGMHTNVWAGAAGGDPTQGVVVVRTTSIDLSQVGKPEVFIAPGHAGALRITNADGTLLTLASSSGATFTFRVDSRQLVGT